MGFWMTFMLACALAMDAFAVAVANGITHRRRTLLLALGCGAAFSFFQMLMPFIGYIAGISFLDLISAVDHWVAAGLLALIGGRMVHGAVRGGGDGGPAPIKRFTLRLLVLQAVATSIDALAVGVGLGFMRVNLAMTISLIGAVAFLAGFAGVYTGKLFGGRLAGKAELAGGVVLLLIGARILAEHIFRL